MPPKVQPLGRDEVDPLSALNAGPLFASRRPLIFGPTTRTGHPSGVRNLSFSDVVLPGIEDERGGVASVDGLDGGHHGGDLDGTGVDADSLVPPRCVFHVAPGGEQGPESGPLGRGEIGRVDFDDTVGVGG